jgi:membrane-bound lytic murein transglycosylase D
MTYPFLVAGGLALGTIPPHLRWVSDPYAPQTPIAAAPPATRTQHASGRSGPPPGADQYPVQAGFESDELKTLHTAEDQMFPGLGTGKQAGYSHSSRQGNQSPLKLHGAGRYGTVPPEWTQFKKPDIPVQWHPKIYSYIRYFTRDREGRKLMVAWLRRSGRYREIVEAAFRERALPLSLAAVAFVESGFWPKAVSPAGAVGLWQFMQGTGRAYGLEVSRTYDERRDIWKSTNAAAHHLADLHERYHSWDLAFAAYNMGYANLEERMEEQGTDDFWSLASVVGAIPQETALYVPKILAVAVVLENLDRFGLNRVEMAPAIKASELEVAPGTRLSLVARAAGTSLNQIRDLNPQFRSAVIPKRGAPVILHVPSKGLARAKVMLPQLLDDKEEQKLTAKVSSDFNWGHDKLEDGTNTPLERAKDRKGKLEVADGSLSRLGGRKRKRKFRSRGNNDGWVDDQRPSHSNGPVARSPGDADGEVCDLEKSPSSSRKRSKKSRKVHDNRLSGKSVDRAKLKAVGRHRRRNNDDEPEGRTVFYRVASGDTLSNVAKSFGLTQVEVLVQNNLEAPEELKQGVMLHLNVPSSVLQKLSKPKKHHDSKEKDESKAHRKKSRAKRTVVQAKRRTWLNR